MIRIFSKDSHSPRLQYICRILFGLILEQPFQLLDYEEKKEDKDSINVCYGSVEKDCICIPDEGLLFENSIQTLNPTFKKEDNILHLYFSQPTNSEYTVSFDLFSAAFYIITEYGYYNTTKLDIHGRYDELENPFFKNNYHARPVLHDYATLMRSLLEKAGYKTQAVKRKFDYTISFDIDSPYLFKYKPFAISAGGAVKDLLKGRFNQLLTRLRALTGRQDPYDVYDYIQSSVSITKLIYFFLIDRNSAFDERHTYRNNKYTALIKNISHQGIQCGLHPSYSAYKDKERITFEKKKLNSILPGRPITQVRMHYLKYCLPDTYRHLISAGFKDDYTSCMVHSTGFRTGMAIPYPWFDLVSNTVSTLTIHPTMIMDRSLQKYQANSPEEALKTIKSVIDVCKEVEGNFVILLHNNTLSEYAEWKGWRSVFEKCIEYLNQLTANNEGQATIQ